MASLGTAPARAANNLETACVIGSSTSNCQAYSPQEIYNLYGTTTDGTYNIYDSGNSTQVYALMNRTNSDNGAWVLLMKGTKGTTNFGYNSTYFSSNASSLSTSSLSNDVTTDAKFTVYNTLSLKKILAVFKDPTYGSFTANGDIASNAFGGHVWLETLGTAATAFATLDTAATLASNAYTNVRYNIYRESNSSSATQVFAYEYGYVDYGFKQTSCSGKEMRWGAAFNNESDYSSCDTYVGIGLGSHSPGDQVTWTGTGAYQNPSTTGKGSTGFQIWGKVADPNLGTPRSLAVSQSAGAAQVSWLPPSSGSVTEYILQYKLNADSWSSATTRRITSPSTTPAVTISGLATGNYDFRVWARDSASVQSSSTSVALTAQSIDSTAPSITSGASANFAENTATSTDASSVVLSESSTVSLTALNDSAKFSIINVSSTNTKVRFLASPDYEAPTDSNADNVYIAVLQAVDSAGNSANLTVTITVTNVNEGAIIGTIGISGKIYKGVTSNITVTTNVAGKVRFFVDGKRVSTCLSISTVGSYPNYTATCPWKPAVLSRHYLTATITPTDNTFSSSTNVSNSIYILKRTTTR